MKKKKLFEYGIDFLYLLGGIFVFSFGGYIAYFGVGMDSDGDELLERVLLSLSLLISGLFYLRYAFHLNYPNVYTRISLFLILCSIYPYFKFMDITFDGDMDNYLIAITSVFGTFLFLLVSGLISLFVGYMKGSTNLENEITQSVKIK